MEGFVGVFVTMAFRGMDTTVQVWMLALIHADTMLLGYFCTLYWVPVTPTRKTYIRTMILVRFLWRSEQVSETLGRSKNRYSDRSGSEQMEQGLESTVTKVNIQGWGLGFSAPRPLGQPLRYDARCVWTTCSSFVSLPTFILYRFAFRGTKSYPPWCTHNLTFPAKIDFK